MARLGEHADFPAAVPGDIRFSGAEHLCSDVSPWVFRPFRTPTFDDEAGETRYFAEAVDVETGETRQLYGDNGPYPLPGTQATHVERGPFAP